MAIQSILMPLSSSGQTEERLRGALAVTRYFNAQLDVLHAQANPRQFLPEEALRMSMPADVVKQIEETSMQRAATEANRIRALLERLCREADVALVDEGTPAQPAPAANWRVIQGLRSELVAELGKVSDLLIIPQPRDRTPTATFEAALLRSGKPVLLVPRTMDSFKADRILLAWNGSTESARAVGLALPLLQRAAEVVVATGSRGKTCNPSPEQLITWLARHGIHASCKRFDNGHSGTGKALLSCARQYQTDLLVMGGFTHRRLHEQFFGGVTRHMVAEAHLPVFLAH